MGAIEYVDFTVNPVRAGIPPMICSVCSDDFLPAHMTIHRMCPPDDDDDFDDEEE